MHHSGPLSIHVVSLIGQYAPLGLPLGGAKQWSPSGDADPFALRQKQLASILSDMRTSNNLYFDIKHGGLLVDRMLARRQAAAQAIDGSDADDEDTIMTPL